MSEQSFTLTSLIKKQFALQHGQDCEYFDFVVRGCLRLAYMFINDAKYSTFVVETMEGKSTHGRVDIGTIEYFNDVKVIKRW